MQNIIKVLIGVSALGFVLAIIAKLLGGTFITIHAETYSRVCNNLALIAIALAVYFKGWSQGNRE